MQKYDVAVVGGGIAGLTAAILAAEAGKRTVVIESQERVGGRGITNKKNGAYFNLGGHALYFGEAYETFKAMGLQLRGGKPSAAGYGLRDDKLGTLPAGLGSLMTTSLLSWKGKLELAALLAKFPKLDTRAFERVSLREWAEDHIGDPAVRNLFYALFRTASYVVGPDLQAAGPVLRQLQSALRGVLYLDHGWGALIDQLARKAVTCKVDILLKKKAAAVQHEEGRVRRVSCEDGTVVEADHIVVTAPPAVAYGLVPGAERTALRTWKEQAIEVTAACLDVALRRLPQPDRQFVCGIDQPVLLTNQSRAAKMSDDGSQLVCLIKYQGQNPDAEQDLRLLEGTLDLVQPGWRNELAAKQYLPRITVCHDFPHLRRKENPGPAVPEISGLYVAGDWASHGELLVDAVAASAKRAVGHILSQQKKEGTPANEHRVVV